MGAPIFPSPMNAICAMTRAISRVSRFRDAQSRQRASIHVVQACLRRGGLARIWLATEG
jgi:hypothetical protein